MSSARMRMKLGLVAAALAGACNEKAARKTDRATAAACSALGSRLVCFAGFTAPSYGAYSVQIKLRLASTARVSPSSTSLDGTADQMGLVRGGAVRRTHCAVGLVIVRTSSSNERCLISPF